MDVSDYFLDIKLDNNINLRLLLPMADNSIIFHFHFHFHFRSSYILGTTMAVAMAFSNFSLVCSRRVKVVEDHSCFVSSHTSPFQNLFKERTSCRLSSYTTIVIPRASPAATVEDGNYNETVPTPKVIIDQDSDPDATVVEITFGDRLGALLDTMNALKNLGLNVVKANVFLDSSGKHNTFAITRADTGRKVTDPELLEAIRLTIINNMLEYHPESSSQLAMGVAFGIEPPKQQLDVDIATHVRIYDDGPDRSLLCVETADRPGLLVDLVKIITDISVAVESGEFDTEGLLAKAKFHVSYKGKAISKPLQQVLGNSLRYFLRRPSTEEGSF